MRFTVGSGILFVAAILSLLVTISVPYIRTFDAVRTYFGGSVSGTSNAINELRLGIWGFCDRAASNGNWICDNTGLAYAYQIQGQANGTTVTIGKSWTRGLVMSAVSTGFIILAFIASFSKHHIIAALLSWWSAFVTLIYMAINIALYAYVHSKMKKLGALENTNMGNGFWMSLATFVILLSAGSFLLVEHRRARTGLSESAEYGYGRRPGFFGRFRR